MKAALKDTTREIKNTIERFISILLIVALGVFVLIGLISTGPIMRNTLNDKVEKLNYADMLVTCPLGFLDEDISIIESQKNIAELEYGYDKELFLKDDATVIKLINYPYEVSMPQLIEGRNLKNDNEILLDYEMKDSYAIGQTISFEKDDDIDSENNLNIYDFKVVGYVETLDYIMRDSRGYSDRGYGKISGFGYILPQNFNGKPTISKINFSDSKGLDTSGDEYRALMKQKENRLRIDMKYRPIDRLSAMKEKLTEEINKGENDISDAKNKLNDAENELTQGREDLKKGKEDYKTGLSKYNKEKAKGENEIKNSRDKLYKAKQDIDENEIKLSDGEKELAEGKLKLQDSKNKIDEGERKLTEGKEKYQKGLGESQAGKEALIKGEEQLLQGRKKLDSGWAKIEDAKVQLEVGLSEYEDGERKYIDGLQKLEDGKNELSAKLNMSYEEAKDAIGGASFAINKAQELFNNVPSIDEKLKNLEEQKNNLEAQIKDLNSQIKLIENDDSQKDDLANLYNKRDELGSKLESINNSLKTINDSKTIFEQALAEINYQLPEGFKINVPEDIALLKNKIGQAKEAINKIESSEKELVAAKAKLVSSKERLDEAQRQLNDAINEAEEGEREYKRNKDELQANRQKIEDAKIELAKAKEKINSSEEKLQQGKRDYEKGQARYQENYDKFIDSKSKLERGKEKYEEGIKDLASGEEKLNRELGKAKNSLDDAKNKLYKGERELLKGEDEYKDKSQEAKKKIEKAREEIKDGRRYLSLIKAPRYKIIPRHLINDINIYSDYSKRVDGLSLIFPVFFFAITLLVSFTTMTRMVEEDRTIIGTYKALGYPNKEIAKKFFMYGMLASLIGGLLGAISGSYILTYIIGNAYSTKTIFEDKLIISMFPLKMIFAIIVGFMFTAIAASLSVNKTLKEKTAMLLRPKPPAKGNRILLEKFPFIWNNISFLSKVTARNLFRSKKRMLMTILGVLGCAALLVLGFGISDSVKDVERLQFEDIIKYNVSVLYDSELFDDDYKMYRKEINKNGYNTEKVYQEFFKTDYRDLQENIELIVPDDIDDFKNYIQVKDKSSGKLLDLNNRGAIVSEKLAKIKKIEVGDVLTIEDVYGNDFDVEISGICEFYLGHYLFMNKDYYETVTGSRYVPNMDLFKFEDDFDIDKFSKDTIKNKSVMNITDMHDSKVQLNQFLYSINKVEVVILVVSTILEIVVLYNLTNINIEERIREVSSIKVLGFYPKESTLYIYKETYILVAIGIILGLFVGKILHYSILQIVVPNMAMLPEKLTFRPFLYAAIITAIINIGIMFVFHYKIKKINPLEALSSVE